MSKVFKTEFAVEMTCQSCVNSVTKVLENTSGVSSFDVDLSEKKVVVVGTAPPSVVSRALKETGRTVIVRGQGVADDQGHSGAAVCIFDCYGSDPLATLPKGKAGLARFVQVDEETCLIDLTVEGLSPGKHGVHIHEAGDISNGWKSTGGHFNPTDVSHGDLHHGHIGDLGNIEVDENGWGDLILESTRVKVWDVIGRSIVITEKEDDFGSNEGGVGLLCGIIARSAGAFENTKLVCACNGNTLWEEARLQDKK
ncbi:hypothetical protein G6F56_006104 [Rhizopus delemar]|uniref:Superoxide dismutase 1 copper chaperone n=1 Tax=Rhizopus stolonifer TaxID=4846 RepID=A0A367ITY3_RHIST|nr:hypothetical protein G6F56_006104 [Rhizopus delemar]RCH80941.1 hypothetical protein CU098_005705 [Rhizopus stolonifer]